MNSSIDARSMMADAKFFEGYSRWDDNLNRYESWNESVSRVMNMHRGYYKEKITPELSILINEAEEGYKQKRALGAQRALQFGGDQIINNPMRLYNCTSTYIDRDEVFGEVFHTLLCGAGAGISVQKHHIKKLSKIQPRTKQAKIYVVEDSIEGWASALDVLMSSFFAGGGKHPEYEGRRVYFDLTNIRPKGAAISGGFKAPGPDPLRLALDKIEYLIQGLILGGQTKLKPIEAYDILMHAADAVLAGGVRRSATICIFSIDDQEMMSAKSSPTWFIDNPQRKRSNNSALVLRHKVTFEQFMEIMEKVKAFGEPGFVFADSTEFLFNPCFAGETIIAVADGRNAVTIEELAKQNKPFPVYSGGIASDGSWKTEIKNAIAFKTDIREVIKVTLSNGDSFECTPEHKLAMPNGEYIQAKDSLSYALENFNILEAKNILSSNDELNLYSITNEELIKNVNLLIKNKVEITLENLKLIDDRTPLSLPKNRFDGDINNLISICKNKPLNKTSNVFVSKIEITNKIVDVYDLKVQDNSNFYILNSSNKGILVHNCVEIGMYPQFNGISGVQGCNLSEINGAMCNTPEDFFKACRVAAILGTLQAGYTNFKFVSETTRKIFEREALIGCSVTGWMNNPDVLFNEAVLREGANIIKDVNREVAILIGINPAARTTCAKPAGNSSVILGTASGIHGEAAPQYLRYVQMNKETEVAQLIKEKCPYMIEESVHSAGNTDYVIAFPIIPHPNSIFKDELKGIKLLEKVKFIQQTWVEEGTNIDLCVKEGLRHNVSNTIDVPDGKWDEIGKYIFDNRNHFAGISLMGEYGDRAFPQAPNTTVVNEDEIIDKYGAGSMFASGLIVDHTKGFRDLWEAITISMQDEDEATQEEVDMRSDWIRRFKKYAVNYFDGDMNKAGLCLKDVYILHKWYKIQQNIQDIDFVNELKEKKYTDIDTMGSAACVGGGCELV
ncbi:MAG: hypothetical protein COA52_01030 [Hyphomicrobiales bacterium]|nr:MAG: hypothetical protein COA52_01030 [Hyphomicrobiales bacterium]